MVPTASEAGFLFGEAIQRRLAEDVVVPCSLGALPVQVALCGFGLAAAGAGAAHAIVTYQAPSGRTLREEAAAGPALILAGIAGTYDPDRAPVGGVVLGTEARCLGIGAGSGERFVAAEQMGWPQGVPRRGLPAVYDHLALHTPRTTGAPFVCGGLLSVTAASGTPAEARARAARHPGMLAEEMEAFAVGLAARLCGVPLTVVRGISNVAGEREFSTWRVREALAGVRETLLTLLATPQTDVRPVEDPA